MPAIQTEALTRTFDDVMAVDSVDLVVEEGEVYGFLGPNGAGKSTTINMLLNYITPSSGTGRVLGHDIAAESLAVRRVTGVLPEDFGVYNRLTARKHVQFAIDTKNAADDPEHLLDRVGLEDAIDRKAGGFSTGMAQRLALAMALVGEPELLILDEPSSGLDPKGAREMRTIIREEVDRGATVFFSSHIMEQVEAVCDRVGIMNHGRIVAEDEIDALKDQFSAESRLIVTVGTPSDGVLEAIEAVDSVSNATLDGDTVTVMLTDAGKKSDVLHAIESTDTDVEDITSSKASLEDLFMELTSDEPAADTEGVTA